MQGVEYTFGARRLKSGVTSHFQNVSLFLIVVGNFPSRASDEVCSYLSNAVGIWGHIVVKVKSSMSDLGCD
jgi:hypothetical protein